MLLIDTMRMPRLRANKCYLIGYMEKLSLNDGYLHLVPMSGWPKDNKQWEGEKTKSDARHVFFVFPRESVLFLYINALS